LRRPFLPAVAFLGACYAGFALALALVDPLALYPWGMRAPLKADGDYAMELTPFLVAAAVKDPRFDTLFIGGSTGHFYTPQMIKEAFPDTQSAFNLSYGRPSAQDRAAVARQLLRYSHARHFILEADWPYILPSREQHAAESFPLYLYDDRWWNDVRGISKPVINLAVAAVQTHILWTPSWDKTAEQEAYQVRYKDMHSPESMQAFAAVIARQQAAVAAPSSMTCNEMDTIGNILLPLVRALSQRGAQIDLLVPPYSWIIYYRAGEPDDRLHRPALLNDVLQMRKCIVQGVEGMPRVRVFAFDDASIGGDFRNYMDVGHLYNADMSRYILRSIANGEHRLTSENIDFKNSQMRANVANYRLVDDQKGPSR
jgi:hypothetical protein